MIFWCSASGIPSPARSWRSPNPAIPRPAKFAADADLRTDLPRYRIWRNGELAGEPADITDIWRDDLVSFLIGCSFTFEAALLAGGRSGAAHRRERQRADVSHEHRLPIGGDVSGADGGFDASAVPGQRHQSGADHFAVSVGARCPGAFGGIPKPSASQDISRPDFGDAVPVEPGEIPVFWACGVTPQAVLMAAKLPLAITHAPGCMFVTDVMDETLAVGIDAAHSRPARKIEKFLRESLWFIGFSGRMRGWGNGPQPADVTTGTFSGFMRSAEVSHPPEEGEHSRCET